MTSRLLVDKIEGKTSSGAVQMPAGHIIQQVRSRSASNLGTVTSTSYVKISSDLDVTITPKFSTSKLIIHSACHVYIQTNNYPSTTFAFYRDGSVITEHNSGLAAGYVQVNTGELGAFIPYIYAWEDANNTNSTTFSLYARSNTGSANNSHFTDLANRWVAVMEVAQ
tara:strand:- start:571 stop:1071 length:501 start_codon:yes stop_codon:yes gene_type:complete